MPEVEHLDVVILGAGQAGVPLSTALAAAGWKTALVEREHVGGTCVNEGCTPTKTLIASAHVAHLARRARDFGVRTGPVRVKMDRVRQRKRDIVASFRGGSQQRIERTEGLELIMGEARFLDRRTVEVRLNAGGTRCLSAGTIFINTGGRPRRPEIPGLASVPYLNSTTIMELDVVPDHLLIVGGGYVGIEFAQMFRRFGCDVTIVQRSRQLLPREDPDVASAVEAILDEDAIDILLESEPEEVHLTSGAAISMDVSTPLGKETLTGSHLLIATGRTPNTDALDLHAAGVEMDGHGYIRVNDRLETSVPGIYALGDVNGGPAFTHVSYDDFRIVRANLLDGDSRTTRDRLVPYVVFMDPQLGRIGVTETQARELPCEVRVATLPMGHVARAIETGQTQGFMKAVVDAGTGQILGAAVLGTEGGELMAMIEIAMMGGLPYTALRDAVFAHPTLAESLNNLFMALDS